MRIHARYILTSEISWLEHGKFYYLEVTTDVVSGVISIEKINSLGNVSNTLLCAKIEQFFVKFHKHNNHRTMKKKELLKRIEELTNVVREMHENNVDAFDVTKTLKDRLFTVEHKVEALEAIVKPIADLQKVSENAKGLEVKIDLSKGPYSPEVIKYDLRPFSDDVANAFLDRFKTEEKKKLEVGKWYKGIGSFMFCSNGTYGQYTQHGFNVNGEWSNKLGCIQGLKYTEATPQEVEEALIKEAKKRYRVSQEIKCQHHNCNVIIAEMYSFVLDKNKLWSKSVFGNTCLFNNGKWAEIVEEKQYTPKIGDVVKAFDERNEIIIGILKHIDGSKAPYKVNRSWVKKIEPITDEHIIKLFN